MHYHAYSPSAHIWTTWLSPCFNQSRPQPLDQNPKTYRSLGGKSWLCIVFPLSHGQQCYSAYMLHHYSRTPRCYHFPSKWIRSHFNTSPSHSQCTRLVRKYYYLQDRMGSGNRQHQWKWSATYKTANHNVCTDLYFITLAHHALSKPCSQITKSTYYSNWLRTQQTVPCLYSTTSNPCQKLTPCYSCLAVILLWLSLHACYMLSLFAG